MRKIAILLFAMLTLVPSFMRADDFTSLWTDVENAEKNDQPRTEIKILDRIIDKATRERAYGHLLKAQFLRVSKLTSITPDSLRKAISRLEDAATLSGGKDKVLASVYHSVLGSIYKNIEDIYNDSVSKYHFEKSMLYPELLAAVKSAEYAPLIVENVDSKIFNNDLLHVIGYNARDYASMNRYYRNTPLRTAALLTALDDAKQKKEPSDYNIKNSRYISKLDSLMAEYGDLDAACEIAIARYDFMKEAHDTEPKQLYDYLNNNIDRWKGWKNNDVLANYKEQLVNPMFKIRTESNVILPNKEYKLEISDIRNISEITINITRVDTDGSKEWSKYNEKDIKKLKKLQLKSTRQTVTKAFNGYHEYEIFNDSIMLPKLSAGVYLIETSAETNDIEPEYDLLYVSDVYVINQELPNNKIRYIVVNASSGQPISNAKLQLNTNISWNKPAVTDNVTTDSNGEYIHAYGTKKPNRVWAYTESDRYMPITNMSAYFNYYRQKWTITYASIFTDRKIYRPGQTIHAAIIAYTCTPDNKTAPVVDRKYDIQLRDVNYELVQTVSVVTDKYGKAAADFTVPENKLTGTYQLIIERTASKSISIEEYKRPTFTVDFDDYNEQYSVGDTIKVSGQAKSYAGVPVQGGKVSYKVMRRKAYWWRWWHDNRPDSELLYEGVATTDNNGRFTVEMPMLLPEDEDINYNNGRNNARFYNILATAKVTDQAGETHAAEISMPIGTRSTALSINMDNIILRDSIPSVSFSYTNMAGKPINTKIKVYIDGEKATTVSSNESIRLERISHLLYGKHTIKAICENDTAEHEFIVFSLKDTRPVVHTHDWFYISGYEFPADGSPVHLQLGTSDTNTRIYYHIVTGNEIIEKGSFVVSNSLHNRDFKYENKYGDAVFISYAWVKDGIMYSHSATIRKPLPDKRLITRWTTFRNQLVPGQEEEWTMHVTYPDGTPAQAQTMAVLFDKTLDQIEKNSWFFKLNFNNNYLHSSGWGKPNTTSIACFLTRGISWTKHYTIDRSHFDESLFDFYSPLFSGMVSGIMIRGAAKRESADMLYEVPPVALAKMNAAKLDEENKTKIYGYRAKEASLTDEESSIEDFNDVQMREDMAETAFFYPTLMTDESGDVCIRFKVPESITTWRFMSITHDADMNYAYTENETVAKKDIMVQPNMPRFLRFGDRAVIAAKVINTSEETQSGTATIQLLNPENEKVLYQQQQPFSVAAGETTNVNFDVVADDEDNMLYICRIVAKGNTFSDGEQHYLPILTDKELVTNTRPFTQHEPGTFSLDLNTLFDKNATHELLTVEYANNPVWMMVQAMPTYAYGYRDDALTQAISLYVNTLGQHIMNATPDIEETVRQWSNGEREAFESELEKNQELKSLILEKTPWVMQANNEAAQRRQLMKFFDKPTMDMRLNDALQKLQRLQNSDGSWSWWQGMQGSTYITTAICEMFARLNKLTGTQSSTAKMLEKAFVYLDSRLVDEYNAMMKMKSSLRRKYIPSETALHILYINSLIDRHPKGRSGTAADCFVKRLSEQTSVLTIYGKACSAVILMKNGYDKRASEYLKSMEEYSVCTPEMGRYYDSPRAYYSWFDYKIPTQVAAIEALKMLKPDDKATVEEMQRWLLQEKRTTSWNTPVNAVDAIYAFLDGNMQSLNTGKPATLMTDGRLLPVPETISGLGYVKTTVERDNRQTFTVDKSSDGTSWGAVYAQFMQPVEDIRSASEGLTVKREIITDRKQMSVGDRIKVRITIKAERDFDFVEVVDKRAACLEPTNQLSGYHYGCYVAPQDYTTHFYFDKMAKGTHTVEMEYYIDRKGDYRSGTATAQCAYSPAFMGRDKAQTMHVE